MKILLTAPPRYILTNKGMENSNYLEEMRNDLIPSLAIYQLASILRESNCEVEVIDPAISDVATNNADEIRTDNALSEYAFRFPTVERYIRSVDIVGISVNSLDWFLGKLLIERIKTIDPKLPIVIGGVHAALADEYILRSSSVDYVVRKEGEKTLPDLLNTIDNNGNLENVTGISYNHNDNILRNEDRPPLSISEMEEMPLPAFDLMPVNLYGKLAVESSRGCRSGCTFCSIPFKWKWRGISPKAACRRMENALEFADKLYGNQRAIYIIDDSFTGDPKRAEDILTCLQELDFGEVRIAFEGRANEILNSDIVRLSKKIPVNTIQIGVESGYDAGLRMIKKGITRQMVEKCASLAKEHDVRMAYGFIIGFPWESGNDCLKTIEFIYSLVSKYGGIAYVNWFHLMPGSDIWNKRKSLGIDIDLDYYDNLYLESKKLRMNISRGLSEEDLARINCEIDKYKLQLLLTASFDGHIVKTLPYMNVLKIFKVENNMPAI
jgi:radical SAM superfamily enzyme YgiQ (UPF0313 family)